MKKRKQSNAVQLELNFGSDSKNQKPKEKQIKYEPICPRADIGYHCNCRICKNNRS